MFSIKKIKKEGKKVFLKKFWKIVAVCFIVTVLIGDTTISLLKKEVNFVNYNYQNNYENTFEGKSNSEIVNEFINSSNNNGKKINKYLNNATKGVLAGIVNNINKSESFLFGILNALNQVIFKDGIGAGIIILIGSIFIFLYWFFISNVILVGRARFFLENRKNDDIKMIKLLYPYKIKKAKNIAVAMFKKKLYTFLWSFTIIGGVTKYYSYILVPYILAENPSLKAKDALMLSKKMTKGYKWKIFLLDLSFFGYDILGVLTLNITNLLYKNPYKQCTYTELYMHLRNIYMNSEKNNNYLSDKYLAPSTIILFEKNDDKNITDIKYGILDIILLFFSFAMIGYIWEVLLHLFEDGVFVNRGSLYGPWLPIYGFGGVITLLLLKRYSDKPVKVFFLSMLICGIIEYFTSWYTELIYHIRWWDYTGYLFNINGRVCLEGLLVFAFGSCAGIYLISPFLVSIYHKIKEKYRIIVAVLLCLAIFIDFCFYLVRPNQGEGISKEVVSKINER